MRFGILGTGAMGGLFAGYLYENGEDVVCLEVDTAIVTAISEHGLVVERGGQDPLHVHPRVSRDPGDLGEVDVLFVFTKAFDTQGALADAAPMITLETRVVSVQNGLRNQELISELIPSDRVLAGYTRAGANTIEPGRVRELMTEETVIGGPDTETAAAVADRLTDAGLETTAVEDPEPYIWDKQFMNVAIKPLAALTELRNGPMIEYEETRAAMRRLIEEAMAVARAMDVPILADDPVAKVIDRDLDDTPAAKKSSILEDVENHRRTEIEHINGAVVNLGNQVGVDTPYNRLATQLVRGKERAYPD